MDMKGLNIHHLTHITPSFLVKVAHLTQVHFIGNEALEFWDHIPSDLVPSEYGGSREHFDYARQEQFASLSEIPLAPTTEAEGSGLRFDHIEAAPCEAIDEEDGLVVPPDDVLVMFLRAKKYRVEDAFKTIRKYLRVRRDVPQYFDNLTPSNIPYETFFHDHKLIMFAKDSQGRAVGYLQFGAWNNGICSIDDLMRCALVATESNLREEETQIRGLIGVVDLKGFGAHHMLVLTLRFARRVIAIGQASELVALCDGLAALQPLVEMQHPSSVILYTDSTQAVRALRRVDLSLIHALFEYVGFAGLVFWLMPRQMPHAIL
ncbi:hypothetical protein HPB52_019027 [Rhipicephalus sanguineus]|uniref:CRAL/TRIO N-terminal domain-containing protein n=1 Tax=Rhipicephalus sanguineus TaxID=34632 RepID=A0A9D4Q7C7_RHISA|nr:hypothetical protein HPB52_019027 [Rhipicephalus sanguineus]